MSKKIVMGILPNASTAETALNNLSEADFDEKEISVIMQDEKSARVIADDVGPLKGKQAKDMNIVLQSLGVSEAVCSEMQNDLKQGKVLLAIRTDDNSVKAAQEMLTS